MKNTFVKVLSMMIALMMVVGMFSSIAVFAEEHECTPDEFIATVPATCSTVGYDKYLCACGEEVITNVVPANEGHNIQWVDATPATCEKPAYTGGYACADCGAYSDDQVNQPKPEIVKDKEGNDTTALGHAWHLTETVEATCTTKGYVYAKCVRCSVVDKEGKEVAVKELPALNHDLVYTTVVAPGTCNNGTIHVDCSRCDYAYDIVEEHGHDWKVISKDGAPARDTNAQKELYKNVPVVGESCGDTYSDATYCTKCGSVKDLVPNTKNTHQYADDTGLGETLDVEELTATLLGMSWNGVAFGDGTATKVEATCTAKGYEIKYCEICEDYKLVEEAKLACAVTGDKDSKKVVSGWLDDKGVEKFDKDTKIEDIRKNTAYHCVTLTRTTTCEKCEGVVATEVKAAEDHVIIWEDEEDETKYSPVVDPKTCFVNGSTTYSCRYCDYTKTVVEESDIALGDHTFPETPAFADGFDCTKSMAKAYIYTCTNKNCKNEYPDTNPKTKYEDYTAAADAAHDWVIDYENPVAATCVKAGYYMKSCKNCTVTEEVALTEANPNLPIVATAHKAYISTAGMTRLDTVTAQSCTAAPVGLYLCECGEKVEVVEGETADHNESGKYVDLNGNGVMDEDEKDVDTKQDATCAKKEASVGTYCTACGAVQTKSVVGKLNGNNHEGEANKVTLTPVAATCTEKGYTPIYYPCCGDIFKVYAPDAAVNADRHVDVTVHQNVPATCTSNGTKAYTYCNDCEKKFTGGTLTDGVLTGATPVTDEKTLVNPMPNEGKGHEWVDPIKYPVKAETCDEDGVKDHKECKNCGAALIGETVVMPAFDEDENEIAVKAAVKIAAHGDEYMGFHSNKAPTCDEDGYRYEGYCCGVCDKITADEDTSLKKLSHKNATGVAENGTCTDGVWTNIPNCTKPSFVQVTCPDCDAKWMQDYRPATNNAHSFKDKEGEWLTTGVKVWDKDVAGKECLSGYTMQYTCNEAGCVATMNGERVEAKAHTAVVNEVEIEISFDCDKYAEFLGLKCKYCDVEVTKDVAVHDPVDSIKAPTCTANGHYIVYCANGCDFYDATKDPNYPNYEKDQFFPMTNHANKVEISRVEPQKGVEGSILWSCPDCKASWTQTLDALPLDPVIPVDPADITVSLDITNALADVDTYTDHSDVVVNVVLNADALNVWGIALDIEYSENLEFVDAKFAAGTGFESIAEFNNNNVDFVEEDGELVPVEVTDYVSILATAPNGADKLPTNVVVDGELVLITLYFKLINTEATSGLGACVKVNNLDIVAADGTELDAEAAEECYDLEVAKLMDVTLDGVVTMVDLLAGIELNINSEYDVALDLDKNGEISAEELLVVVDYINGAVDFADIIG